MDIRLCLRPADLQRVSPALQSGLSAVPAGRPPRDWASSSAAQYHRDIEEQRKHQIRCLGCLFQPHHLLCIKNTRPAEWNALPALLDETAFFLFCPVVLSDGSFLWPGQTSAGYPAAPDSLSACSRTEGRSLVIVPAAVSAAAGCRSICLWYRGESRSRPKSFFWRHLLPLAHRRCHRRFPLPGALLFALRRLLSHTGFLLLRGGILPRLLRLPGISDALKDHIGAGRSPSPAWITSTIFPVSVPITDGREQELLLVLPAA